MVFGQYLAAVFRRRSRHGRYVSSSNWWDKRTDKGWSVRLEQSFGPCPQSELHRSCFQAPAKDIFIRTVLAHAARWGGGSWSADDALYKSTHWHWHWHWNWLYGREMFASLALGVRCLFVCLFVP